jgi:hypothetical protein
MNANERDLINTLQRDLESLRAIRNRLMRLGGGLVKSDISAFALAAAAIEHKLNYYRERVSE